MVSTGGLLPLEMLMEWSLDLADGLWHLLRHGVVHRDLKPDNIMIDEHGGPEGIGRLVIIDLGTALSVGDPGQSPRAAVRGSASGIGIASHDHDPLADEEAALEAGIRVELDSRMVA